MWAKIDFMLLLSALSHDNSYQKLQPISILLLAHIVAFVVVPSELSATIYE